MDECRFCDDSNMVEFRKKHPNIRNDKHIIIEDKTNKTDFKSKCKKFEETVSDIYCKINQLYDIVKVSDDESIKSVNDIVHNYILYARIYLNKDKVSKTLECEIDKLREILKEQE